MRKLNRLKKRELIGDTAIWFLDLTVELRFAVSLIRCQSQNATDLYMNKLRRRKYEDDEDVSPLLLLLQLVRQLEDRRPGVIELFR